MTYGGTASATVHCWRIYMTYIVYGDMTYSVFNRDSCTVLIPIIKESFWLYTTF